MRALPAALLLTAGGFTAAVAQQTAAPDTMVAKTISNYSAKYMDAECQLTKGHYKVSSGATYLSTAIERGSIPENRLRALASGRRVITEAIQQNGQDKNAAAWYYLGRIDLHLGDVAGADSAFKRAEALAPGCAQDIGKYRRVVYAPIANKAIDFTKANQNDSALVYYRRAAAWYPASPLAPYNLANIFATSKMDDSALVYYDATLKATMVDTAAATVKIRNQAGYNRAVLLTRKQRWPDAVAAFQQYLTWVPDDADAKKGLIQSLRAAGMADSASAMEKKLGVTAGNPMAPAAVTGATADYNAAVQAYNAKNFAAAAAAADKFLVVEPNNRDALYMRARSYVELKKGPEAAKAANALLAVDPMSETALSLLGAAYNLTRSSTQAVNTRLRLNALPFTISSVTAAPSGA
ncbi:MAG: tetratricopeptide repeat protein, partial [Gemmatimonadales bacterium]|nr:tetratricopeptide repeat protein [Gemmatimonadales bacterium]